MSTESPGVHRFTVLADHYQFYLQDLRAHAQWMRSHGADPGIAPAGWTDEAVYIHRIGVEPHSVAIGTARSDVVETALRLHPAEPRTGMEDAEHIVEADIDVPSGDLAIYGPADDRGQEEHISITPGRYRARVSYLPSGPPAAGANDAEYGDHFIHQVDLWPASKLAPIAVLRQGTNPWAG